MYKNLIVVLTLFLVLSYNFGMAQSGAEHPAKRPHDWWQADWKKDSLPGISLDQAYEYLKGRKSKPVIVAIIDNCVDTANEELRDFIWTNKKEIPGNGIDDDHNGYVDDMHGWCFIANKNNEIQEKQCSDELRVYQTWKKRFENIDTTKLKGIEKVQYYMYLSAKKTLKEKWRIYQLASLLPVDLVTFSLDSSRFIKYLDNLSHVYADTLLSKIPFSKLPYSDTYDSVINQLFSILATGQISWGVELKKIKNRSGRSKWFGKIISDREYRYDDTLSNFRNVMRDDPDNFNDRYYGTPAINLPQHPKEHATFIAGIISANRINGIGINGIADDVLLMPLVAESDGSITDKDLVMAIHYAVDNGASIINMSFNTFPFVCAHVKEVRDAFDYAYKHNVLIVNAAGNDGADLDNEKYFLGQGAHGKEHDTYIRVGATTTLLSDSLVGWFSQFGEKTVDLFAPGTAIYSTFPGNEYQSGSGTSFATPVVAGIAALLKSYFPSLKAKQIKEILMKSVYKPDVMVTPPFALGIENKIPFSKMSKSGGIVNAYNAVKLADEITRTKHSLEK
jgi:subtilisin family serine protease